MATLLSFHHSAKYAPPSHLSSRISVQDGNQGDALAFRPLCSLLHRSPCTPCFPHNWKYEKRGRILSGLESSASLVFTIRSTVFQAASTPQSIHRVATAAFWRAFHNDEKISPGWFNYIYHHEQSCSIHLAERADTLPLFPLYPYVFCAQHSTGHRQRDAITRW